MPPSLTNQLYLPGGVYKQNNYQHHRGGVGEGGFYQGKSRMECWTDNTYSYQLRTFEYSYWYFLIFP